MIDLILLFGIGLISGIFAGFFGVGGGFFLTPVLNILGLQIVCAIGTSLFALIGNGLFGAWQHLRLGNVDLKLGTIFGLSSIGGVELGKMFVLYLESQNLAGRSIRVTYIVILILIAGFVIRDYRFHRRRAADKKKGIHVPNPEKESLLQRIVLKIGLSPKIEIHDSKLGSISFWVLLSVGLVTGFLSAILGVGGGFISLPLLIYVIGIPTIMAVGTSLVIVFLAASYGAFAYAFAGHVDLVTGLFILSGSLFGVQMGVTAAKNVVGEKTRILFAVLLLSVAFSVFLKETAMPAAGGYLVVSASFALCLIILWPVCQDFFKKLTFRKRTTPPSP